jgi:hypothetical protein
MAAPDPELAARLAELLARAPSPLAAASLLSELARGPGAAPTRAQVNAALYRDQRLFGRVEWTAPPHWFVRGRGSVGEEMAQAAEKAKEARGRGQPAPQKGPARHFPAPPGEEGGLADVAGPEGEAPLTVAEEVGRPEAAL